MGSLRFAYVQIGRTHFVRKRLGEAVYACDDVVSENIVFCAKQDGLMCVDVPLPLLMIKREEETS